MMRFARVLLIVCSMTAAPAMAADDVLHFRCDAAGRQSQFCNPPDDACCKAGSGQPCTVIMQCGYDRHLTITSGSCGGGAADYCFYTMGRESGAPK